MLENMKLLHIVTLAEVMWETKVPLTLYWAWGHQCRFDTTCADRCCKPALIQA